MAGKRARMDAIRCAKLTLANRGQRMTETFSYDRASFAERAAKLAGVTTFREPVGGRGTKHDHMPDEHTIAACFAYSRRGERDTGPDIAVAIITGTDAHAEKIVRELASALMDGLGRRATGKYRDIRRIAAACYLRAVRGTVLDPPEDIDERLWKIASVLGDRVLWQAADESIFRAEIAYRRTSKVPIQARAASA